MEHWYRFRQAREVSKSDEGKIELVPVTGLYGQGEIPRGYSMLCPVQI